MTETPPLTIRPATADELPAAAKIYAANESEAVHRYHPLLREPDNPEETARAALEDVRLLFAEDPRQVWVATHDEVVAFAAAAMRDHHWHLTYLFVASEVQERGIGGALLRAIHAAGREAGCTLFSLQASDDPRALTRYFRLGLLPQPFSVVWSTDRPQFPAAALDCQLQALPIGADDEAMLNTIDDIDKAVRGVRRRRDIQRWLREGAVGALLSDRMSGKPAGYYLVAVRDEEGRIGPVASLDVPRFAEVLTAALTAAGAQHRPGVNWTILAPGENWTAIDPILDAGFRPRWCDAFFASAPIGHWQSYLCHDLDLL